MCSPRWTRRAHCGCSAVPMRLSDGRCPAFQCWRMAESSVRHSLTGDRVPPQRCCWRKVVPEIVALPCLMYMPPPLICRVVINHAVRSRPGWCLHRPPRWRRLQVLWLSTNWHIRQVAELPLPTRRAPPPSSAQLFSILNICNMGSVPESMRTRATTRMP